MPTLPRSASRASAKHATADGISIFIDMEDVLKVLAAGNALSQVTRDMRYIDSVVDVAFERTDDAFTTQANARARAGSFAHMYEWGTVGINSGRTNMRLPAENPNARLWHQFSEGSGMDRTITFAYRPSVANVPKPTKKDTGMSQEVISKLRDHIFRWKAEVMEEGHEVTINRRTAKFLLIPVYASSRPYVRPNDAKRGYTLSKGPITARPGSNMYYGAFTKFWEEWWLNTGADYYEAQLFKMLVEDYEPELRPARTSTTMRPIGTLNVKASIASKKKKVQANTNRKARARKAR